MKRVGYNDLSSSSGGTKTSSIRIILSLIERSAINLLFGET